MYLLLQVLLRVYIMQLLDTDKHEVTVVIKALATFTVLSALLMVVGIFGAHGVLAIGVIALSAAVLRGLVWLNARTGGVVHLFWPAW